MKFASLAVACLLACTATAVKLSSQSKFTNSMGWDDFCLGPSCSAQISSVSDIDSGAQISSVSDIDSGAQISSELSSGKTADWDVLCERHGVCLAQISSVSDIDSGAQVDSDSEISKWHRGGNAQTDSETSKWHRGGN